MRGGGHGGKFCKARPNVKKDDKKKQSIAGAIKQKRQSP
jgi:hypothetical protein